MEKLEWLKSLFDEGISKNSELGELIRLRDHGSDDVEDSVQCISALRTTPIVLSPSGKLEIM